MGVPVPLYSVPETRLPGTGGGIAVTEVPGGMAWEGTQQTHLPPGKSCRRLEARSVHLWWGTDEGGAGTKVRRWGLSRERAE